MWTVLEGNEPTKTLCAGNTEDSAEEIDDKKRDGLPTQSHPFLYRDARDACISRCGGRGSGLLGHPQVAPAVRMDRAGNHLTAAALRTFFRFREQLAVGAELILVR